MLSVDVFHFFPVYSLPLPVCVKMSWKGFNISWTCLFELILVLLFLLLKEPFSVPDFGKYIEKTVPFRVGQFDDFAATIFSLGPLICQRPICGAMIWWSSERKTVFVTSFYIPSSYMTVSNLLPFFFTVCLHHWQWS